MASSNRTGLGVRKERSKKVLKTSIDILTEFSQWAKDENEDPYMAVRDLYEFTYEDWRKEGRQPIDDFPLLLKCRKVNKYGLREMHYKVIE